MPRLATVLAFAGFAAGLASAASVAALADDPAPVHLSPPQNASAA
ncbi:MAG: hypothetical protein V2I65_12060 [Paracoccaceae bacterium]|jgi:hypothetical protein|nr:hypothetical protein [Paracoccaceae bacterium]